MIKQPPAESHARASSAASTEAGTDPRIQGTPARPAFKRRGRVFALLFVLYVAWMAALVAMSIQLHRHH